MLAATFLAEKGMNVEPLFSLNHIYACMQVLRNVFREFMEEREERSTRRQWNVLRNGFKILTREQKTRNELYQKYGFMDDRGRFYRKPQQRASTCMLRRLPRPVTSNDTNNNNTAAANKKKRSGAQSSLN